MKSWTKTRSLIAIETESETLLPFLRLRLYFQESQYRDWDWDFTFHSLNTEPDYTSTSCNHAEWHTKWQIFHDPSFIIKKIAEHIQTTILTHYIWFSICKTTVGLIDILTIFFNRHTSLQNHFQSILWIIFDILLNLKKAHQLANPLQINTR